jgi:hypothetical protein
VTEPLAEQLLRRVLAPLQLGGELRPLPPIGRRARLLAAHEGLADDPAVSRARLVAARRLWPIDELPPLGQAEWLLLSALNDLLQVPNPTLPSLWTGGRPGELLGLVSELLLEIRPPHTALEALCRYATFADALSLVRIDTDLTWWTGSRRFVGARPPARLSAWPRLRRVRREQQRRALPQMAVFGDGAWAEAWQGLLERWLFACPLVDLASGGRQAPRFRWTRPALALLETSPARSLGLRAALRAREAGIARIAGAASEIAEPELRALALDFVRELTGFTGYSGGRG